MADKDGDISDKKRAHKERKAGRKAEKKKEKDKHVQDLTPEQRNPKAFTFRSTIRAERQFRRSQDITAKKQRLPWVDRTPLEPPPVVMAIVGPPKVGKTTLMKSLLKNYTRQKISEIKGPVTIVTGKKRRLTIVECNNDINCMIDIAKVADIVMLMVDASFGFEMETFEFLNICQVHGFPNIMGILTHLDMFRKQHQLRERKKTMKHRFWKDVYPGAKLFYLSGLLNHMYHQMEIRNLARFISIMKVKQMVWKSTHPHVLADRIEDLTSPEDIRQDPKCDRTVSLYGYVRGSQFKNHSSMHIAGCGDVKIKNVTNLPDPCPLPDKEKKRTLLEKERVVYAPFSGLGGLVYDKDAVYVNMRTKKNYEKSSEDREAAASEEIMSSIIDAQETIDEKLAKSELHLFKGSTPMSSVAEDLNPTFHMPKEQVLQEHLGRVRRKAVFDDNEEDVSMEEKDPMDEEMMEDMDRERIYGADMESPTKKQKLEATEEELIFEDSEEEEDNMEQKLPALQMHKRGHDWSRKESKIEDPARQLEKSLSKYLGEEEDDKEEDEEEENVVRMRAGESENKDSAESDSDSSSDTENESDRLQMESRVSRRQSDMESAPNNKATDSAKDTGIYEKITKTLAKYQGKKQNESQMRDNGSDHEDEMEECEEKDIVEQGEREHSDDEEEVLGLKWKDNLAAKAASAFYHRQLTSSNIRKLVYNDGDDSISGSEDEEEKDEDLGGLFRIARQKQKQTHSHKAMMGEMDCSKFVVNSIQDWDQHEVREQIKDCFVTGKWKESEDAEELLQMDDEDDDLYGDFEDLETGEIHSMKAEEINDNETQEGESSEKTKEVQEKTAKQKRLDKKRKLKLMFDAAYDEAGGDKSYYDDLKQEMLEQSELNRNEFVGIDENLRIQLEGYRPGMYIRLEVESMPCEFVTNFDATYPVMLGGLTAGEENIGYVQVRLKKHRWHKKILKTRDPLIFSLGWRRFQSIPLYSIQDHNMRNRLLKYTPEHLHCNVHFWGPITPQNTGILAIQCVSEKTSNFRIAATGTVVNLDKSTQLMKKLKLVGYPFKVYKSTAFIQGMFNSALEVARFQGAAVRTVSGIRGQIKKGLSKPEGAFRAKFEDCVVISDIVFLRTWYRVEVPRFYNPVTSLLLPASEKSQWEGMKTLGQLKREKGITNQVDKDSMYTPVERKTPIFRPLYIPKALQRELPFIYKPKLPASQRRYSLDKNRIAVIREPHEQKIAHLMKMLKTTYEDKQEKRRQSNIQHGQQRLKQKTAQMEEATKRYKVLRKQVFRTLGKMDKKKTKGER